MLAIEAHRGIARGISTPGHPTPIRIDRQQYPDRESERARQMCHHRVRRYTSKRASLEAAATCVFHIGSFVQQAKENNSDFPLTPSK